MFRRFRLARFATLNPLGMKRRIKVNPGDDQKRPVDKRVFQPLKGQQTCLACVVSQPPALSRRDMLRRWEDVEPWLGCAAHKSIKLGLTFCQHRFELILGVEADSQLD